MKRKINLLPIAIVAILFFILNWYVLSGLLIYSLNPLLSLVFWLTVSLITLSLIAAINRINTMGMGLFFKIATHAFVIWLTAALLFAIVLLTGDVYRLFSGTPRNLYWVEFATAIFALTVLVFLYGMIRGKYAYRVIKHTLFFDDLPQSFDGFTITQISDIHAGSFQNPKAVQKGIDLIKAQKSDLFVFTGDLVNNKAEEIKPWIGHFSQIKAPYGQFSVLGNHDYGDYIKWENEQTKRANLQQLKAYHAELGFRLLLDEHVELYKHGEKIILAGVENWGLGFGERGDLKKALTNVDPYDFKVLLSHDPTHWDSEVKKSPSKVHLTLSGHTHGMQFGIEAFGIKWSPVKYRYAHWAGIASYQGRFLNINRGFGFLGFSGRVGIWPEITVIELKKSRT
ncbi:metallophosphoesterase [Pedobacter heparinus]|uniref:Metallophosphoesterase n=1 Tax=Pedobacter heparinus (strain ATCC 13125 / DSM 2366 / CIP 104194 / JCM 7457 / NBRC 12017 / NCIMB 9290 / NRRL B-14731 / HIM 762-3) TaxID=485917 RepID=C6Y365_PEDHD|nr:metallophosphoesterase [Pedobacter heparinus]ACU05290.1 metallophosphoesterase [Pedobacter heparinus DSM 2366]